MSVSRLAAGRARAVWLALALSLAWLGVAHAQAASPYTTNYVWDQNRRLTMKIEPDPGSGVRVATRYVYDLDGELIEADKGATTQSSGSDFSAQETTTYAYDAVGNKVQTTVMNGTASPALAVTQVSYDADDRPLCTAVRMNASTYGSLPDACTLGTAGSYGNDRITETIYDAAGQAVQTVRALHDPGTPSLQQTYETMAYTPNGKVQYIIDARGNRTQLVYDGFDRQVALYFPSATLPASFNPSNQATALASAGAVDASDFEQYAYDADDNRVQLTKRDGQTLYYCYDALDREIDKYINRTVNCASPPALTGNEVATSYDLASRKLSALYPSGQGVSYAYDNAGRLTRESTNGQAMTYGYDLAGNRTQVTWPDSVSASYVFDAMNRVSTISASGVTAALATYSYDALGRISQVTYANGTSQTYTTTAGASGYDGADRLTALRQLFPTSTNNQVWTYAYNPASQVITQAASNSLYQWTNHPATSLSKAYDGLNRDSTITALTGGYDKNGDLTYDGTRTFTYDVENRLLSDSVGGSSVLALSYDPLGRLNQTTAGASSTQFLYDGERLAAEYNGSTLLRRYVHGTGTDNPIVWFEGSGVSTARYLATDRQGSVIAYSDTSGNVTSSQVYAYGPYGEPNSWGGSRFAYTGQIQLPEAQLYFYKARVYDPITGRFLQTDPVGYKDDIDLYAYVKEDSINRTDPSGNSGCGSPGINCPPPPPTPPPRQLDSSKGNVSGAASRVAGGLGVANDVQKGTLEAAEVGAKATGSTGSGLKTLVGGVKGLAIVGDILTAGAAVAGTVSDIHKGVDPGTAIVANLAAAGEAEVATKGGELAGLLAGIPAGGPGGQEVTVPLGVIIGGVGAGVANEVAGGPEKAHDAVLKQQGYRP